ncbi:MAG: nuclear transport factor 2 family protein [Gemmatimonadaceae bacterium]
MASLALTVACAPAEPSSEASASASIDSLNKHLSDAYHQRDPAAYAALFTDSAEFEWPALAPVRGHVALAAMAKDIWAAERDVALRLRIDQRRLATDHGTEFGAFEQSWTDSAGVRRTEFGRYATLFAKSANGRWLMERFLGFEDSTRVESSK